MNTHADKIQQKSKSTANAVSQKQSNGKSTFQFIDNRPETISLRKLQKTANNSSQTMQLATVILETDTAKKKKIRAEGTVDEFQDGTSAGSNGWLGVEKYRAYYSVSDSKCENKGESGTFKNDYTNPEAGHVLAKQNGGDGSDAENIFGQDGGTNNGKYKSFEIAMRKDLDKYDDDDDVKFTSYLAGTNITSGKIADAGLSDAESISSEDSD